MSNTRRQLFLVLHGQIKNMGQNGRILCSRNGIFVINDETGNAID
ncbi:MAG: hypothetical protein CFH00_01180, partial [Alphaproteobacteria bacterium MarineAlpha1_Bin1]